LTLVAGPGYRKALEFLVKDFLIKLTPEEEKTIKATFLGSLIRERVKDQNLRACAERAAWLGNDETHYNRIWKDADIEDLKNLITLTTNWIISQTMTEEYLKKMPAKEKPKD